MTSDFRTLGELVKSLGPQHQLVRRVAVVDRKGRKRYRYVPVEPKSVTKETEEAPR